MSPSSLFVHYEGWHNQFDEEIQATQYPTRLAPLNFHTPPADAHNSSCLHCKQGGDNLLMCDGCPRVAHLKCANLLSVPRGDWFCAQCISKKRAFRRGATTARGRAAQLAAMVDSEEEDESEYHTDDAKEESKDSRASQRERRAIKVTQRSSSRKRPMSPALIPEDDAPFPLLGNRHTLATKSGGSMVWRPGDGVAEEVPDDEVRKQPASRGKRRREEPSAAPPPAPAPPSRPLWSDESVSPIATESEASSLSSSSSSPSPLSATSPILVTGVPAAPSSSSRKRAQAAKGSLPPPADVSVPPHVPPADIPQPSMTCFLDCYQFAFDRARIDVRTPAPSPITPSASSSSSSSPSSSPFPIQSDQGTPANIPTFSFPPICLLHDHRALLVDFCRLVDADASKPPMAIKLSTPGIERWRVLVERLIEYRSFLLGKINQRMNSSNEERVEMGKRKSMTESTWKEAKARLDRDKAAAEEERGRREVERASLASVIDTKRAELRRLQEEMAQLEAAEAEQAELERAAAEERQETVRVWEAKLRGVDEEAGKITTILNVLQALRDHIRETRKESAEDRSAHDRPPWEPFNTVLTRLCKLEAEEAKRKERSPQKAELKEAPPPYIEDERKAPPAADGGLIEEAPVTSHPSPSSTPSPSPSPSPDPPHPHPADVEMDEDAGLRYLEHKYDSEAAEVDDALSTQPLEGVEDMDVVGALQSMPSLTASSAASSLTSSVSSVATAASYPPLTPDSVTSTQTTLMLTQSQHDAGKPVLSTAGASEAVGESGGSHLPHSGLPEEQSPPSEAEVAMSPSLQ